MDEAQPIWERFVAQNFQMSQQSSSLGGGGILGARSLNLSSSSMALTATSAALMREFTVRPVAELLSEKALQELANRNRLVEYFRACLENRTKDATGHARVRTIAVAGIEVRAEACIEETASKLSSMCHIVSVRKGACTHVLMPQIVWKTSRYEFARRR